MTDVLNNQADAEQDVISVRPAKTDDLNVMTRLLRELFDVENEFAFDAEKQQRGLQMLMRAPQACVWVAERRGRVVGMVTMQLVVSTAEGGWSGLLEDLVVSSPYRRHGIGRALLNTAVEWCVSRGATRIQLLADGRNVPALVFYRKQEWKQTNMIALGKKPLM